MKKGLIWKIMLAVGILPFLLPFITFGYEMLIGSGWTLLDWLIMYSFIYWPTYLIGLILIAVSASKLMDKS